MGSYYGWEPKLPLSTRLKNVALALGGIAALHGLARLLAWLA